MQLIQKIQIGLVLVVLGLLSLALPAPIKAACGGDCSVDVCESCDWYLIKGKWKYNCRPYYCTACNGSCQAISCGPGQYECNRTGGCCDVAVVDNCPCGTKPSGVCQSCEPEPPPPPPPPPCSPSCGSPLFIAKFIKKSDLLFAMEDLT